MLLCEPVKMVNLAFLRVNSISKIKICQFMCQVILKIINFANCSKMSQMAFYANR